MNDLEIRQLVSEAKERRRYALLQAAATIHAGLNSNDQGCLHDETEEFTCVFYAKEILREIEKRERAE